MFRLACLLAAATLTAARPDSGYGAPEPAYAEPAEPAAEYSAPAYAAPETIDLASLAIPVLVVVGLMLLFPTYVNLTTVRRSFADAGPVELLEKIKDVAQAVLEDSDVLTKYD